MANDELTMSVDAKEQALRKRIADLNAHVRQLQTEGDQRSNDLRKQLDDAIQKARGSDTTNQKLSSQTKARIASQSQLSETISKLTACKEEIRVLNSKLEHDISLDKHREMEDRCTNLSEQLRQIGSSLDKANEQNTQLQE